jgi:hypothetical protein
MNGMRKELARRTAFIKAPINRMEILNAFENAEKIIAWTAVRLMQRKHDLRSMGINIHKSEEIDTSAQLPQTPDQSRQKANLEASAWRASQANISAQAETKKGSDGLANYTDLPPQRSQQAAEAYKAIEKPEQQVSVDAIV